MYPGKANIPFNLCIYSQTMIFCVCVCGLSGLVYQWYHTVMIKMQDMACRNQLFTRREKVLNKWVNKMWSGQHITLWEYCGETSKLVFDRTKKSPWTNWLLNYEYSELSSEKLRGICLIWKMWKELNAKGEDYFVSLLPLMEHYRCCLSSPSIQHLRAKSSFQTVLPLVLHNPTQSSLSKSSQYFLWPCSLFSKQPRGRGLHFRLLHWALIYLSKLALSDPQP